MNSWNKIVGHSLFLTTAVMILSGCYSIQSITGSGLIRTESRAVVGVRSVEIANSGNLDIVQGPVESLSIETDDNILPAILTEMRGDALIISTKPGFGDIQTRTLRYHLVVTDLRALSISGSATADIPAFHASNLELSLPGSGSVAFDKLQTNSLNLDISGSGHITVSKLSAEEVQSGISGSGRIEMAGETRRQSIDISGSGEYLTSDLHSSETKAQISGSGSIHVACVDKLTASISGSGNVIYSGSPKVDSSISGSGSVEQAGKQ